MLGQLVVSLGLNSADFTSGLSKSELQAKRFGQTMDRAVATGVIKAQVAIMAIGAAIRGTVAAFQTLTTGAAQYQDFAEMIGGSAEEVASLAVAAATAGVEMSSVVLAANRLTKGLVGVDEESSKVRAGLKALNINIGEFKNLSPVEQYEALGKALGGFAESADKSAIAQDILGKSGAEQLKVFAALQEAGGRQTILTQRQIELSDQYADAQAKASAELRLYAQAAASEATPALTDLTKAFVSVIKEMMGVDKAGKLLSDNNAVKEFAKGAADAVAFLADAAVATVRVVSALGGSIQSATADVQFFAAAARVAAAPTGTNIGLAKEAFENRQKVAAEANQKYLDLFTKDAARFRNALSVTRAESANALGKAPDAAKPKLPRYTGPPDTSAANSRAAVLKKELDGEIKAIRDFAEQQRDALDFANRYAKGAYDAGEMSLAKFYENEGLIRAAALQVTVSALDEEIAVLRRAATRSGLKLEERVDAENKIAEAVAKRSAAVIKGGYDAALATQDEARAVDQLRGRYDDLRTTIMQLSGDTDKAARERIDKQVSEAQSLIKNVGGDPAEAERYRTLLTNTEALSKARQDYNRLLDRTRASEEAIYLAAQTGGESEEETLRKVGSARAAALSQMAAIVDQAKALANALKTEDAIQFAEQLAAGFARASAEVDPLLKKTRALGEDMARTISSGLEDIIFQGKNAKDVLKDIGKELAALAIRQLLLKPFEQSMANMIGGTGYSSPTVSGNGAPSQHSGWLNLIAGYFLKTNVGGGNGYAGSAYGGVSGSGGGNGFGIGYSGAAIGGPIMPNSVRRVGENGPEVFNDGSKQYLINGSRGGSMNPNPRLGGQTINAPITITVAGNTDRSTMTQIGAVVARQIAYASRNN